MASLEQTFAVAATVTVEVRRLPLLSGSPPSRGAPAVVLAASKCTPFYPLQPNELARTRFESPHEIKQTLTLDAWKKGDVIYVNGAGKGYPVVSVAEWPWPRGGYIVNDVRIRDVEQ